VAGLPIQTCDPRLRTLAAQDSGRDRVAVRERAGLGRERGVTRAHELGGLTRAERDALPIVELAVGWTRRRGPIPLADVAADAVHVDGAADVATRRFEAGQLVYLPVDRAGPFVWSGSGLRRRLQGAGGAFSGRSGSGPATAGSKGQHCGEARNCRENALHGATVIRCVAVRRILADSGRKGLAC